MFGGYKVGVIKNNVFYNYDRVLDSKAGIPFEVKHILIEIMMDSIIEEYKNGTLDITNHLDREVIDGYEIGVFSVDKLENCRVYKPTICDWIHGKISYFKCYIRDKEEIKSEG